MGPGGRPHCLGSPLAINRADSRERVSEAMPTAAVPSGEIAHTTARILLEIGAVLFRPNDPFILTSGRASPVYIDFRKIISFPPASAQLLDFPAALIRREAGYDPIATTPCSD